MKYATKIETSTPGAPLWIVTFSDMMTLLLACFVLLLSFSTVNPSDFGDASRSLNGALGAWRGVAAIPEPRETDNEEKQRLHEAAREFRRRLQVEGRENDVGIAYEGQALRLVLYVDHAFAPESRNLLPDTIALLGMIDSMIARVPRAAVLIEGHTGGESLTDSARYADNVAQSYALAEMVYAALRGMPGGINAHRPTIAGMGDARPIASVESEEGRRRNRRVELVIRTGALPPVGAS